MIKVNDEILNIIREQDLGPKLIEGRQLEREKERDDIIRQLILQEDTDKKNGEKAAILRRIAEGKLRDAEASAAAARREINAINAESSLIGHSATVLRGKLRNLADPRIEIALMVLRNLVDLVRKNFSGRTISTRKNIMGDRSNVDVSNGPDIDEVTKTINDSIDKLAALQEQPRPSDLPDVIEKIIARCGNEAGKVSPMAAASIKH